MTEAHIMPAQIWVLKPHDEALWRPTVPLVVMFAVRDTKRPRLLSAWLGLRWLSAFRPDVTGWTGREIAHAAMMSAEGISADLRELHQRELITQVACPGQQRYITDSALLARLEHLSIDAYPSLITRYGRPDSDTTV